MMETLEYYEVGANSDTTEGRGPINGIGIAFKHKCDAVALIRTDWYAKRYGVMGCKERDGSYLALKRTVDVYESIGEYHASEKRQTTILESALAALTDEQKEALGISDSDYL